MVKKKKCKLEIHHIYSICLCILIIILLGTIHLYNAFPQSFVSTLLRPIFEPRPIVILDAGHGGYDSGSEYDGIVEKDVTLSLALEIGEVLENRGIPIAYTRNSDKVFWPSEESKDLQERVKIINSSRASYMISIHTNASEHKQGKGFEIWVNEQNEKSVKLANSINDKLSTMPDIILRGIKNTTSLFVLKHTTMPSILIEAGFLESKHDQKYLLDTKKREEFVKRIADGIEVMIQTNDLS